MESQLRRSTTNGVKWEISMKITMIRPIIICAILSSTTVVAADRKPNIIVIFTDDHGYADLSCQGVFDDVRTPYMDSLARGGCV